MAKFFLLLALLAGCAVPRAPHRLLTSLDEVKNQIHLSGEVVLTAGVAKVEITPAVGTPLAGYSKRRGRPSVGIRDPLFVRALALSDGEDLLVLVSADILIFPQPLVDEIRLEIARELKIPQQAIVLAATHTHSGIGAIASEPFHGMVFGRYDREVVGGLKSRIVWAVRQAAAHRHPVLWGVETQEGFLGEWVENRTTPGQAVDSAMSVLFLQTMDGKPFALLINAAAHPTLMDSTDFRFSADYPGEVTRILEAAYPPAICLFTNGAAGDLRPRDAVGSSPDERIGRFGRGLAEAAQALVNRIDLKEKGDLAGWGWRMKLPPPQLHLGPVPLHPAIGRLIRPRSVVGFNLWGLDGLLVASVPAEPTADLGLDLKRRLAAQGKRGILIGYANGYEGYAVTDEQYRNRSYESWMTWYGPTFGASLNEKILEAAGPYGTSLPPSFLPPMESKEDLPMVVLSGSPYQMGYQHGSGYRAQVRASVNNMMAFVDRHGRVPVLGRWIARLMLDRAWRQMKPHVPPRFLLEMRGLSDGSGVALKTLERLHALPELTATTCASFAAYGEATQGGHLIQIRNLDWAMESDVQRYAAIFFHRPDNGHAFVSVGWFGFIGVISGISEEGISVAEVGAETVDFSLKGIPMPFLLRQVLEEVDDLKEAVEIFQRGPRTGGYNYLFADAGPKQAVALETTHRHCAVFWGGKPVQNPDHLFVQDALFRSDVAFDPEVRDLQLASRGDPRKPGLESPRGASSYEVRYRRQGQLLLQFHGRVDAEIAMAIAGAIAPSSNLHSIVYAYPQMWVANAVDRRPAAEGRYVGLDLKELFDSSERKATRGGP